MDDNRAKSVLDSHFSMTLGCTVADLHRPGWTIVPTRDESDPGALLFGQRTLLSLLVPGPSAAQAQSDALDHGDSGVAKIAAELRSPVAAVLQTYSPNRLFSADGQQVLWGLMRSLSPESVPDPEEATTSNIYYATRAGYTPYFGEWQEWIEPLDEFGENEPSALRLLARYSGGVYVVRRAGVIAGYAGILTHSPRVAEISVRTAAVDLRGHALGRAVVSRATKAVFAAGRVPIYRYSAGNTAAARVAASLGYRFYAEAVTFTAQL
jgi:RimJ/RimL family protein N-acetyltransferase